MRLNFITACEALPFQERAIAAVAGRGGPSRPAHAPLFALVLVCVDGLVPRPDHARAWERATGPGAYLGWFSTCWFYSLASVYTCARIPTVAGLFQICFCACLLLSAERLAGMSALIIHAGKLHKYDPESSAWVEWCVPPAPAAAARLGGERPAAR